MIRRALGTEDEGTPTTARAATDRIQLTFTTLISLAYYGGRGGRGG
jgi:hypothetical protein